MSGPTFQLIPSSLSVIQDNILGVLAGACPGVGAGGSGSGVPVGSGGLLFGLVTGVVACSVGCFAAGSWFIG